jgi:hypothetical protein
MITEKRLESLILQGMKDEGKFRTDNHTCYAQTHENPQNQSQAPPSLIEAVEACHCIDPSIKPGWVHPSALCHTNTGTARDEE